MKNGQTFSFIEDKNTTWFCRFLLGSKEWMIWAERNGEVIFKTKEFKKRLSQDWKDTFNIK